MMNTEDKFTLELTQEEGILLLTSARLLDKLVAGVTIHARERDELIREIIGKLGSLVTPALASMSDELADAIVESVLGLDEQDDSEFSSIYGSEERVEVDQEGGPVNCPMYSIDETLPVLEKALVNHVAVRAHYYNFTRESVDLLTLDPLKMLKEDELWRMVAYCHERDDVLIFRVDRIKDLVETALHFDAPSNFNQLKQVPIASYC